MARDGKPLSDRQQSYLDTVLARLRSNDFEQVATFGSLEVQATQERAETLFALSARN